MKKRIFNVRKNGVWYLHLHSKLARTIALSILMFFCTIFCVICISGYVALSNALNNQNTNVPIFAQGQDNVPVINYYDLQTSAPYTVAVDAGHGGMDTGAQGIVDEVSICETTAEELFILLDNDNNFNPVLTHEFGTDLSTTQRAQTATMHSASLLISIHINNDSSNSQSHGFECYAVPPGRYYHEKSLQFANIIAQKMSDAGHRLRGDNGVRYLYYINGGDTKKIVESSVTKVYSDTSFGMLEKPLCPSVLVEQCFMSNQSDYEQWATAEGSKKAARVYYEAICAYFNTVPLAKPM